jgi:signal transduction histidine kinase
MPAIAWLHRHAVDACWGVFAAANFCAMVAWPSWETIPFHFVWISLTLVYGFRVWSPVVTTVILSAVVATTGGAILADAFEGTQLWGELFEVPLMSAMFLAMVWHARRRQAATRRAELLAERQERFLHDVSHELRTPVTIARGHLDLLGAEVGESAELAIALDELGRIDRIILRLLLLARTEQKGPMATVEVDVESFLGDIFMRWSGTAPRSWQLGSMPTGTIRIDTEDVRAALDALVENAVKHTEPHEQIEISAVALADDLVVEVSDEGVGIPEVALDRIFDRFARGDDARTRSAGGVGLGLSIVRAVARAHGGAVTVSRRPGRGTSFLLRLPGFKPAAPPAVGARPAERTSVS